MQVNRVKTNKKTNGQARELKQKTQNMKPR